MESAAGFTEHDNTEDRTPCHSLWSPPPTHGPGAEQGADGEEDRSQHRLPAGKAWHHVCMLWQSLIVFLSLQHASYLPEIQEIKVS